MTKIWIKELRLFIFYSLWVYFIILYPYWGIGSYLIGILFNFIQIFHPTQQHKVSNFRSQNPFFSSLIFLPFRLYYHFIKFIMFLFRNIDFSSNTRDSYELEKMDNIVQKYPSFEILKN